MKVYGEVDVIQIFLTSALAGADVYYLPKKFILLGLIALKILGRSQNYEPP
jgi:hypothetical protein